MCMEIYVQKRTFKIVFKQLFLQEIQFYLGAFNEYLYI